MTRLPDFSHRPWILITGGTHGIGRALVDASLDRDLNVVTVGLDNADLINFQNEFKGNPRVLAHPCDLTAEGAVPDLLAWLTAREIEPTYLINNAGFGRGGLFEHTAWAEYHAMMTINNRVLVELCYQLLPALKKRGGGILNMSSMEATLPLPYKTVYTGTKAFVYSFSLALRQEFRHHGVGVSVLCPGPVITNEDGMKRVLAQGWRAKLLVKFPADIAPEAIAGLLSGQDVIRPGLGTKFFITLSYVVPRKIRMRLLEKIFSRYRNDVPVKDSLKAQSRAASSLS